MLNNYNEILYYNQQMQTDRMILRKFAAEDAADLLECFNNENAVKYLYREPFASIEEARAEIFNKYWAKYNSVFWAAQLKDGGVIGSFDLQLDFENNCARFGMALNPKYWGQGYASEGLRRLMVLCFEQLDVNRLDGLHFGGNIASGRVMEKNGMRCEGTAKEASMVKGQLMDDVRYAILKTEYFANKS